LAYRARRSSFAVRLSSASGSVLIEKRELEHTDGLEVGFEGGEHGVELRAFVVADDQFAAAQPMCAGVL
jgi:hypothetical protein